MSAYDVVLKSREKGRPTAVRYISNIVEGFIELHGDRRFADDRAVIGGVGTIGGKPVTVIGIEKGEDTATRLAHNFGCANPEGYRKAVRLMKEAEKFHRPVLCFVDTSGAYCGIGAEERGQSEAIAMSIMEMIRLKTPTLSVIIGEGGSGGALGLCAADEVWITETATYSVISPEGCRSQRMPENDGGRPGKARRRRRGHPRKRLYRRVLRRSEGEDRRLFCREEGHPRRRARRGALSALPQILSPPRACFASVKGSRAKRGARSPAAQAAVRKPAPRA